MPASFIPDPHKGPGNGIIIVTPLQCTSVPTFALINASDRNSLSPEGWQSAEVFLEPEAWDCENEVLRLAVGPNVVDHLDKLDMYKLHIKDATGTVTTYNLVIDDILQSSMAGGQGVGMAAPVAAAAVVAEPAPEPEPEPIPEPEPMPEASPEPDPLPSVDMPPEEPVKKSPLPIILGIVLLCALLGGALWWYFTQYKDTAAQDGTTTEETQKDDADKAEDDAAQNDADAKNDTAKDDDVQDAAQEDATKEDAGKESDNDAANDAQGATEDTQKTESSTTPLGPMESARELMRKNDAAEKSYNLAQSLKEQAANDVKAQDAIFLLLEDAAQKGMNEAMNGLGTYYDPSSTEAKGTITPDAREAYTWYTRAQQAGDAQAAASLERLRTWAEEAAQKGDASAKELLNIWKK